MLLKQKGFSKIIIIVVVLAVLAGSVLVVWRYWPQPSPELSGTDEIDELDEQETEGWQTYRNEEWGFEVKYPTDIAFRFTNEGEGKGETIGAPEAAEYFYLKRITKPEAFIDLSDYVEKSAEEQREKFRIDPPVAPG